MKDIFTSVNDLKQIVYSQTIEEKMRILKAVFSDFSDLSFEVSDILSIIECTSDNYAKLNSGSNLLSLKRIPKLGWIQFLDNQTIIVIYSNSKPSPKFRKRTLLSISYPHLLKSLRTRINYFLDTRIDRNLSYEEKLNFLEYIVSVLNPDFYSSTKKKSYLLPMHYQRVLFYEIYNQIKEKEKYENILDELVNIVSSLDSYEQCSLLLRNNMISSILRNNYCDGQLQVQAPNLDDREKAILGFLKQEFYEQVKKDGLSINIVKDMKQYAGRSANFFRENLRIWMKGRFDPSIISIPELRETPIKIMEKLQFDGFVNISYIEKTRTKLLYSLNLENKHIQKLVYEGWLLEKKLEI
ncbi:MAG: hypothetical protein H7646_09250 [Candidatus Heimdallarchaeota archaeon]|nr:hypothetical protein [Candidatus Heimdallarchaeota archaeon]